MDEYRELAPWPTVDDCLLAVLKVSSAVHLRQPDTLLGNMVRTHLAQAVLMSVRPPAMPDVLATEPLVAISQLPGPGGHRERTVRCLRVGRQLLVLYCQTSECQAQQSTDLTYAGRWAYRLAADESASYDRWFGELWWDLNRFYLPYAQIIATSRDLLLRSAS